MKRHQLIVFLSIAVLVAGAVTALWAFDDRDGRPGTSPTIGTTSVKPAYIVVKTRTPVVFTAQIADRRLNKRSVVLVRLDAAGKPSDILGRLTDDGQNGDARGSDNIYSLRVTLNEAVVGTISFKVAARFSDDDSAGDFDWDKALSLLSQVRDSPARRQQLLQLLLRVTRYTLSARMQVIVHL